jgi:hypothetical protein
MGSVTKLYGFRPTRSRNVVAFQHKSTIFSAQLKFVAVAELCMLFYRAGANLVSLTKDYALPRATGIIFI